MKKYDLIIGFGCSFMEGGGLDNQTIHMRMHGLETPISLNETEINEPSFSFDVGHRNLRRI